MGRVLALDYGTKRTGIAITDELQLIASGLTTVETPDLLAFITKYVTDETVDVLVVGEPKQRDGSASQVEPQIQKFLIRLQEVLPQLEVVRTDERFTSKMAFQSMLDGGLKKSQRRNKALIDEISATIILQAYLENKPIV